MTCKIRAAVAALLLTTLPGTLSAQQSPVPPAEVPQASPSAPQGEPKDSEDWWHWPERMREWMMTQDWDPRRMMDWRGDRGPGMMWGGGLPMHSGMMPMMMMAMLDTDESGSISYEEIEVVHRRMFNLVDKDNNGELSPEEIQDVMGWRFNKRDDENAN